MQTYLDLLTNVLETGEERGDRTGTGTLSVFGRQVRYDLREGFPCLTTKKLHLRSIIHELLWFLRGDTNARSLNDVGVKIWDEWAGEDGDLGPVYGKQWRAWPTPGGGEIDQIAGLVDGLKNNPRSRRHLVCAWNVGQIQDMALPPCHCLFQCQVANGKLSCLLYQRSADMFLGVPFNVASYALLTMMVAQVTGLKPGEFIHCLGDTHIYSNHLEQVDLQLQREPYALPVMRLDPDVDDLFAFRYEHFTLENYRTHPHIPGKVAV